MNEEIINKIKGYFSNQPIEKAWLFGSYARGEETSESDIDLLVDFEKDAHIGLLKYADMVCELENLLHLRVDMVENGFLKPFAIESANKDKILIYERTD